VLNETFSGTVLYNPINTFMYCILGSKIDALSKALTWLRDHAHITLPSLPPNVLQLSPAGMAEMTGPISAAAVGSGTDATGQEDEGAVGDLIRHFQKAIEYERNFYAILLGVWLGFAVIGLVVVAWNSGGEERYRSWSREDKEEQPKNEKAWAWRTQGKTPLYDEHTDQRFRGTAPTTSVSGQNRHIDYSDDSLLRPTNTRKSSTLAAERRPCCLRMGTDLYQEESQARSTTLAGSPYITLSRSEKDLGRTWRPRSHTGSRGLAGERLRRSFRLGASGTARR
jgi:hypothetical protein